MKRLFLSFTLMAAWGCYILPAADAAPTPQAAKAGMANDAEKQDREGQKPQGQAPEVNGTVGEYMKALTAENLWVGEKPAADAEFYIYLSSASWCVPCNAEMPHVVKEYAKMRENGRVELILMSGDRSQSAAKVFAERYNATFPVLNIRSLNGQLPPGYTVPRTIPNAIIVDSRGTVIRNGHGTIVQQWASLTVDNPDYAGKK